jgi:DNA-binding transcriptional ArsR family regulator
MPKPAGPTTRSRPGGHAAALRALSSATRQEIVDVLAGSGPLTVARLAELLGRRPDALYFHVRTLQRAGLVREQPAADRGAAVFRVPEPVRLDYDRGARRAIARVVRLALRLAQREYERECLAKRPVGSGGRRILWGGRVMGWVAPRDLARVNALLAELHAVLRRGRPGPGRRAISLGFLLAPAGFGDRVRASSRKG